MEAKFSVFFIRPRKVGLGRLAILLDSAGRLPACRCCSYTPSRMLGGRDRLEAYPPVAGLSRTSTACASPRILGRFLRNPIYRSASTPTNPFTVWSIALPVYGLFTTILGRSFFMIQNFPQDPSAWRPQLSVIWRGVGVEVGVGVGVGVGAPFSALRCP